MLFFETNQDNPTNMNHLFPPSMSDWLPTHHFAQFIIEIPEQLDSKDMECVYGIRGRAPFHSVLLLSILVYGYATGMLSRESTTYDSAAFGFLTGD